jgi:opacity protein-like surface antigen
MPELSVSLSSNTAGAVSSTINVDLDYLVAGFVLHMDAVLTENVSCLLSVQDSVTNFADPTDTHTLMVWNPRAGSGVVNHVSAPSVRDYQLPLARIGISGAKLRIFQQSIGGIATGSVSVTLRVEIAELIEA